MGRPKRKESEKVVDDIDSDESDGDDPKKSKTTRMKKEEEEVYLKLCVEHFEAINDTTTARGTPNSSSVKERKQKENHAWERISEIMNKRCNVSFQKKIIRKNQSLNFRFNFFIRKC